jgi:hypothetical protein
MVYGWHFYKTISLNCLLTPYKKIDVKDNVGPFSACHEKYLATNLNVAH